nr:DNA polymerase Y family protein [Nakamurella flavida]
MVLWCPDWPAVAAARQAGVPTTGPVAVFHANRVRACTAAARAEGIRIGQRRRDAQSRCPELVVLAADPDRDARLFAAVPDAVESVAPGVEILRAGLLACSVRGPARYFGSETAAAERIVDIVEALDIECRVGVADVLSVAVLAARASAIVPIGGSAEFCAPLPVGELARDPAIAPPERAQLVDLLIRLGLTTVGSFAALPEAKVATRFGVDAVAAHRLARGVAERGLSRRSIPEDLTVEQECDPPLDRVDTAAFAARALAERFHARLADAGLACTRLAITARTESGAELTRTWRCARPLTAAATADRLRWQLDGWLTAGRTRRAPGGGPAGPLPVGGQGDAEDSGGPGAITLLRLDPIEAVGAGLIQYGLWGSDGQDDQRAGWALARVQGLLGPESVLTPTLSGGRSPGERVTLVPWGEEKIPSRDPAAPWPGAVPSPSPTRLPPAGPRPVRVLDHHGDEVVVDDRGRLSGPPVWIGLDDLPVQDIASWAGPWLVDERWWSPPTPVVAGPGAGIGGSGAGMTASVAAATGIPSLLPARPVPAHAERQRVSSGTPGFFGLPDELHAVGGVAGGGHGGVPGGQAEADRLEHARRAMRPTSYSASHYETSAYRRADTGPVAGPLVDTPAAIRARVQLLTGAGAALLLLVGTAGWQVEGVYD